MVEDKTVSFILINVCASGNRDAEFVTSRPIVEVFVPIGDIDLDRRYS